jgi:uncharacterized repeat protein (TIGR03803 family)
MTKQYLIILQVAVALWTAALRASAATKSSSNCISGCGAIFRISPSGKLTTLHGSIGTDGGRPSPQVQGRNGDFYGTAAKGGACNTHFILDCGTVFKVTRQGDLTTLHSFCAPPSLYLG